MALRYKTKNSNHPKGKPRVYFCCHPEDHNIYFDAISDELLSEQDCTIWYYLPTDRHRRTLSEDLKEMHLFVMPVTHRLLSQPNNALDVEFRFAIEHHIPVLPLLQDPSLLTLFAQKCGDLQFLNKYEQDDTAIPFKDKLSKYLESVLIGNELADKIRQSFDAYIFLSYRKKDRKYAQELMRLIHKSSLCRDVAIWYDEFLIPGESFNEAIKEAMKKSRLFVLAVTPNLVNQVNYVMTTEYPMALKLKMPILPAELVPTDRLMLAEKYPSLPKPADPYSKNAFQEQLHNLLAPFLTQKALPSAEHSFHIGLAYLSGLDVEVDHKRALELITKAADDGLVGAIQKLVDMFQTGTGVERDYKTAIYWQEQLMSAYAQTYTITPNGNNARNWIWALLNCGDMYRELHLLPRAKTRYKKALDVAKQSVEKFGTWEDLWNALACCDRLGNIFSEQGNLQAAKDIFNQALMISNGIAQGSDTPKIWHALAAINAKLGDIARIQEDQGRALELYQNYLELNQKIVQRTGTPQDRRNLAVAYERLGIIAKAREDWESAKTLLRKALKLQKKLRQETNAPEHLMGVSSCYINLGTISQLQGDLNAAKNLYENALGALEELRETVGTPDAMRNLSVCYDKLGEIAFAQADLNTAKEMLGRGAAIHQALVSQTGAQNNQRDLSVSYDRLGDLELSLGNLSAAKCFYEKALAITEKLAKETDIPGILQNLAVSYNKLGEIEKINGSLHTAKTLAEKAITINKANPEKNTSPEVSRNLAASYDMLGEISRIQGDLTLSLARYKKAMKLRRAMVEGNESPNNMRNLAASYNNIVFVALAQKDFALAKDFAEKAAEISLRLVGISDTPSHQRDLSVCYDRLGDIARDQNNWNSASDLYKKSLDIRKRLAEQLHTPQSIDDLAVSHFNLGRVCPNRRIEYLSTAVSLYTTLAEQHPDVPRYRQNRDSIKFILSRLSTH